MKNLLEDVGLSRGVDPASLEAALSEAHPGDTEVLANGLRLDHYERVHLQYEAIALACGLLEQDSHRWLERTVEFVPTE